MNLTDSRLGIVQLFPTLMGTYGDGGNLTVLTQRALRRGLAVDVVTVGPGEPVPRQAQLYVIGGGEDHGQVVAAEQLRRSRALQTAADAGACVFAVCAGLQVLGQDFEVGTGAIEPGVGLLDLTTRRRSPRAVGEVLAEPDPALGLPTLTGYENHGGGTLLGPGVAPLAHVTAGIGNGAGGAQGDGSEGAWSGQVLATYLHGPVLARNPALADLLLTWAVGSPLEPLPAWFTDELRAERQAYVASGKLSAAAADTRRGWRLRERAAAGTRLLNRRMPDGPEPEWSEIKRSFDDDLIRRFDG